MRENNPYANALDGLHLNDPVTAFFDYCREREKIRLLREDKTPYPWTSDKILQKGRFLNVFRERYNRFAAAIIFTKYI